MNEIKLGKLIGVSLTAEPQAILASILLWLLLTGAAIRVLNFDVVAASAFGLAAVALHWLSAAMHNLGHALAARRTGYPMAGLRLGRFGLFGTCLFPAAEPVLSPQIHIRRALGGPVASLGLVLAACVVLFLLHDVGGLMRWLGVFFLLDNVAILLASLLPLGFTDGGTLLRWSGKNSSKGPS